MSIFNLAKDQWTSHNKFTDTVRQIFRNRQSSSTRDSQTYDIGVLIGASTFRFYKFLDLGKIKLCKGLEDQI